MRNTRWIDVIDLFACFINLVFQNTTLVDSIIFFKPHPILLKRLSAKFIKSKCLNIQKLLKGLQTPISQKLLL